MTSRAAINLPKQLPTLDLHEALHSNNIQPDSFTIKKKRKYKTIHELNPNPNLLSKKAIKTREMKMKHLKIDRNEDDPLFAEASDIVETKLGGRQLQLLKSPNPVFSKDVPTNYIRQTPDKSEEQDLNLLLGSRQKNLANNHRSNSAEFHSPTYRKLTRNFIDRRQNSHFKKSNTNSTLKKKLLNGLRNSRKFETSIESKSVLGSRQLELLKTQISNETINKKSSSSSLVRTNRRKKGRVRKVLTGRRKITSSELILKAASFFP